jgi:methylphosphotriester-DNA--protein-cysteine methyltransferase
MNSNGTVQVPAALIQRMVGIIEKSANFINQVETDREQVKQAAPEVVETLITQGLLGSEQKEAAFSALTGSHSKVLESLRRTATHVTPKSMGHADDMHKAAQADDVSNADRRFLDAMGF